MSVIPGGIRKRIMIQSCLDKKHKVLSEKLLSKKGWWHGSSDRALS
jgi:hypothetical protein